MPLPNGYVGGTQLPVPAGATGDKFTDPLVEALLDFSATYIKWAIDAKLANLTGTPSDAVPTANRFTFDPLEPRGHSKTLPRPALFVWWGGRSRWLGQTMLYATRVRNVNFMYVFDELPGFDEMDRRSGLMNAIDAAMFQMTVRQVVNTYGYGTAPAGSWINTVLADPNMIEWDWQGAQMGRFGIDEGPLAERRAAKRSGRDWPALRGDWQVEERVALQTLSDPADVMNDIAATIYGSDGETTDGVVLINGVLTAPDGSEQL
ncbi:MAG: hypothetical protein ACE5F9_15735 [Phycisphaerae bacterium]